jgi:predicted ArsR family transcriptional regulator
MLNLIWIITFIRGDNVENSRTRIVNLIQLRNRATAEELATALDLAPATVRRHLDILQRDSLVSYKPVHKRAGRPHYAYFLTDAGQDSLPKDYHRLADWILDELGELSPGDAKGTNGEDLKSDLFRRIAERRAMTYKPTLSGLDPEARLAEVSRILNRENFRTELQQEDNTLLLFNYNCPYHSIASRHKELCTLDLHFVEDLLQMPVSRKHCLADGDEACVYQMEHIESAS